MKRGQNWIGINFNFKKGSVNLLDSRDFYFQIKDLDHDENSLKLDFTKEEVKKEKQSLFQKLEVLKKSIQKYSSHSSSYVLSTQYNSGISKKIDWADRKVYSYSAKTDLVLREKHLLNPLKDSFKNTKLFRLVSKNELGLLFNQMVKNHIKELKTTLLEIDLTIENDLCM